MKPLQISTLLSFFFCSLVVNAQPNFRSYTSEFFIEVPSRGRYTISLGDETISSSNGRFRFFELRAGKWPVEIELNNRLIFTADVFVKPGIRTIAVLNRNSLNSVQNLDLRRYTLDNWDRIISDNYRDTRPNPGRRPHHYDDYAPVMSTEAFERLQKSMREAGFSKDKLAVLDLTLGHTSFTISQIKQVMNLMSFTDEKLDVVSRMYPSVADPQNSYQLLDTFSFSDDKEKVKAIIMAGRNRRVRS